MNPAHALLKSISSLRLTVVLFSLSMVLILAGTLAQTSAGIWTVVDEYFRSLYVLIPFQVFLPEKVARIPGVFPFPGGLTLGVLLFINLLAAHITRFKLTWKRSGIIMSHAGVLLLLVGEFVTGAFAKEGNMSILEGSSSNFVEDIRTSELAIVDSSDPADDLVVVVPQHFLASAGREPFTHGLLPFEIKVEQWMDNSRLLGPMQASKTQLARATAGTGKQVAALPAPRATGVDGANVDVPAAYLTLSRGESVIGTYLVSPNLGSPQQVDVGGKRYSIELRFERGYKPYTIELIEFRHDKFVGTEMARNFSSRIRLKDPARHVDREVLISMNEPLRYAGETFYQSAFMRDAKGTILQVVRNPGWLLPYVSCSLVTLGLLVHFGIRLVTSVRRKVA
jgi:ResB-like family